MEWGTRLWLRALGIAALSAYARAQSNYLDYNCQAGLSNCEAGWSDMKKSWCCRMNMCCQPQPIPKPYNCNSQSQWDWSRVKRKWCCIHEQKGCRCSGKQYDCNAGLPACVTGWSNSKKDFCYHCRAVTCSAPPPEFSRRRRTPLPAPAPTYKCDVNFHNQAQWSMAQRKWCCEHDTKYCAPYNCNSNDLQSEWPITKQRWCCKNRNICVKTFDCAAGVSRWKTGWSPAKKEYCCQQTGNLGCPGSRLLYAPRKYEVSDADEEPMSAAEPTPAVAALAMALAAISGLGLGTFGMRMVCRRAAASRSQTEITIRGSDYSTANHGAESELQILE